MIFWVEIHQTDTVCRFQAPDFCNILSDIYILNLTGINFSTRIDVYETLCPQQMLVHKGGKIKNWGGECRDVTPTKSLSQNIRVDVNREVKGEGGVGGGGVRMDVNEELKFL